MSVAVGCLAFSDFSCQVLEKHLDSSTGKKKKTIIKRRPIASKFSSCFQYYLVPLYIPGAPQAIKNPWHLNIKFLDENLCFSIALAGAPGSLASNRNRFLVLFISLG